MFRTTTTATRSISSGFRMILWIGFACTNAQLIYHDMKENKKFSFN